MTSTDDDYMDEALSLARQAARAGEVPVGAVVVFEGKIVGRGFNRPVSSHDPTAHAEIQAIRQAAEIMGNYRLPGTELFATLEPCAMCAGAIMHARISRVVFGARDPKTGVCGSTFDLFGTGSLNHHAQVVGGVREAESVELLRQFFSERRSRKQD